MDMDCASAETLVHPASLLTQASSLPPKGRSDHMQRTDAPLCRFAPATDVMQQCRQSMSAEGADIATEERRISMDLRARQSSAPARLSIDQMWEAQAAPKRAVHDNPFNNIPNTAGFFS